MRSFRRPGALLTVLVLAVALLGACGDDDEEPIATTTTEAEPEGTGEATVTGTEYAFEIDGTLTAGGLNAITFENRGEEIHMMVLNRLKDDVTIDDVIEQIQEEESADEEGGAEGGDDDGTTSSTRASRQRSSTSTTADDEGAGTSTSVAGGEEEEGPFEETTALFDSLLTAGDTQTITAELVEPGTYAVMCFVPAPDGRSHAANGMVGEIEVAERGDEAPTPADAHRVTLEDGDIDVDQQELPPGETTFEVQNVGEESHAFTLYKPAARGGTLQQMSQYLSAFDEGEVPEGDPPGAIAANHFEMAPGETAFFTLDVAEGEYILACTYEEESEEEDGEGEEHIDRRGESVRVVVSEGASTSSTTAAGGRGTTSTTADDDDGTTSTTEEEDEDTTSTTEEE